MDYLFPEDKTPAPATNEPFETAETRAVSNAEDIDDKDNVPDTAEEQNRLSEEEAIAQGYTVIKTAEDLAAIGANLSGKYIIMDDIDMTGVDWTPIGSSEEAFSGIFNGNGYTIKNLNINAQNGINTENIGFFGVTDNAEISNINIANATVSTPETYNKGSAGILIGRAQNTNIDNVYVSGTVTGHQKTGGMIGTLATSDPAENSKITNSTANTNVNSSYYAGGLIGYIETFSGGRNVMIENVTVNGNVSAKEKSAGGIIGEAGSTIVTINNSTCAANVTGVDGAQRIGGFIGNANGTKIAICNSNYTGKISAEGDFKGEYYGYYMNDAHVSIFELSAGLPADDILKIDGVDTLTPIYNSATDKYEYEIAVSTLTGLDKVVAMIRQNPELAEVITFNVNFDFEAMDGQYSPSVYAQYGVVQHQYEDEEGNVVNDVYIDNEIDTESTFHRAIDMSNLPFVPTTQEFEFYEKTMVEGLYKDKHGRYYVETAYGMIPTTLSFFFANQQTNVQTRLDEDEVSYRNKITSMVYTYQAQLQNVLKTAFNYDGVSNIIIGEPEYNYLTSQRDSGAQLTDLENLQLSVYELDMQIAGFVNEVTHNEGCGMGGNSSFLEETTAVPLYDEDGRMQYETLSGVQLRQSVDAENNPIFDDSGAPVYETPDGEPWEQTEEVFIKRGYPQTDENGRFMYTDSEGATVFRSENEDGTYSYSMEDGSAYEGDPEELKQQLEEYSVSKEFSALQQKMQDLLAQYQQQYGQ